MEKEEILKRFLISEADTVELAQAMLYYINSLEIRRGEFEGNEFILQKLNRNNFLIYPEYEERDEWGEMAPFAPYAMSIYRHDLVKAITDYCRKVNGEDVEF